jgi:UDP-N-acetyl-D-mannosaminuronic acid dehydrogenase
MSDSDRADGADRRDDADRVGGAGRPAVATDPLRLYGADASDAEQRDALTSGGVPVAVYGLGKMGLPLAGVFAETTGNAVGVDVDESVVDAVNDGRAHVDNEPGLDELVAETVDAGALRATADGAAAAADAALHVVVVPTLLDDDRTPDLSLLETVLDDVAAGLDPGDVVFVESTVPPATCRDAVRPTLAAAGGLDAEAFGVACCPERTASGRALRDIRRAYPKVVGGVDDESTRVAELVYDHVTENDVVAVSDATTAASVKLFEGLYRDVNIALANELARARDDLGIDVAEAIDAANTLSLCDIHDPGAGVGGHCIPYYPYFVMAAVETETPLLRTARGVNDSMPAFVVRKLREGLAAASAVPADTGGDGPADPDAVLADATVAVLGLTYRAGVRETRSTPAKPVVDRLTDAGATVLAADPMLSADEIRSFGARPTDAASLPDETLDAAALVTAHDAFVTADWDAMDPLVVVDGRDALSLGDSHHSVYTVGRG